ncbi:hypothetical protein K2173_022837 [Erythroxylum novogranatense]|uniref:Kinetochore protein SPC25 n=1 Tax=Erythroxylum novogranatense TaxID=1862640 RepID=A0AAV8SMU9_9ROSI|nr:hypothetical protein K2173_022837 [Erythroxylum novogranatense]
MESVREICERAIPVELQKMDAFTASFAKSLDSIKARAEETARNQVKLGVVKSRLREAEDEFVKVLAVKTRNEAQQMAIKDSMSATRARIEELKRTLQVQKARKDYYAAVMSQQTVGKRNQENEQKEGIEEAVFWYNRVLGFHIEGGHGVKFTFRNISMKNPYDEYSFTIRHENDTYTLLTCDPQLNDTKDLIHELNRTNGFFKFVRTMREKFKEAASTGVLSECKVLHQESSTVSLSAPALSVSTDRSESPLKNEHQREEIKKHSKMNSLGKGAKQAILSPVRKSPRFKAKK